MMSKSPALGFSFSYHYHAAGNAQCGTNGREDKLIFYQK